MRYLLAIDQGTTSSRAVLYDFDGALVASCQREFPQYFPEPGWVEHEAEEIWKSVVETIGGVLKQAGVTGESVHAIGITNQRETAMVWDRETGVPVHRAIVWQDRRTAGRIDEHTKDGVRAEVKRVTGLELDPYFSATKIEWILDHVPGCRARAEAGGLAAGTVDAWLVWKLTGGREHLTDVTNASRTLLMDLDSGQWSEAMLELFRVPRGVLPQIVSSSGKLAEAEISKLGLRAPICGMAGDQQAALIGQRCHVPGAMKCTYGTGCFLLMFTGRERKESAHRLLTTVAWRIGDGPMEYALEGGVFVGGAAVQWLRDGLGIIKSAPDVNTLARSVPDAGGTIMVPAFAGLGAPHWDPAAKGIFMGITRGTTAAHLARATLEGIAFQVMDLVNAMRRDAKMDGVALRVDGGASASDLLMQMQADVLGFAVERPGGVEATAAGAAFLAGIGCGIWSGVDGLPERSDGMSIFNPMLSNADREARVARWQIAVELARGGRSK